MAAITSPAKIPDHNPFFVQQELEKFKCNICDIVFITSTHLTDHNKSVHEEQNQSQSDSVLAINNSADVPNEEIPVEENNSEPPKERIILKLKKYNCEHCDKSFAVSKDLRRHINAVHEGKKNFVSELKKGKVVCVRVVARLPKG